MEYYDFVDLSFIVGGLVGHPSVVGKFPPPTHTPQREQVEFFDFGRDLVREVGISLYGMGLVSCTCGSVDPPEILDSGH